MFLFASGLDLVKKTHISIQRGAERVLVLKHTKITNSYMSLSFITKIPTVQLLIICTVTVQLLGALKPVMSGGNLQPCFYSQG